MTKIKIEMTQRHIDAGGHLNTNDPLSLAIKEELDKRPVPPGVLRVERVVGVSSSVYVGEHRIVKRKGREEVDLFFEHYWFDPIRDKDNQYAFNIYSPVFDFSVAYGNGEPVQPITFEITLDEPQPKIQT